MNKNDTGIPSTNDFYIGRGKFQLAWLDSAGKPKGFRDVGNVSDFTLTVESETLEHYTSRSGLKKKDAEVVISQDATGSFTLDSIEENNAALFFSGESVTDVNPAIVGDTDVSLVTAGDIVLGTYVDLFNDAKNKFYGIDSANLTIKTTNASPVTLVEGTDYTVSEKFGQVFLMITSTVLETAIAADEGLTFDYAADTSAPATTSRMEAMTQTTQVVACRFYAENAATGDFTEWTIWKATVSSDGDFSFISDEFTTMGMSISANVSDYNSRSISAVTVADR